MSNEDKFDDADIFIYTLAKMKKVHIIQSSEVIVNQYSNQVHEKLHEAIRINAPDELEDNHSYKNATVGMIRTVSIKPEEL